MCPLTLLHWLLQSDYLIEEVFYLKKKLLESLKLHDEMQYYGISRYEMTQIKSAMWAKMRSCLKINRAYTSYSQKYVYKEFLYKTAFSVYSWVNILLMKLFFFNISFHEGWNSVLQPCRCRSFRVSCNIITFYETERRFYFK